MIKNNSNNNASNDFLKSVNTDHSSKESVDIFDIEIEKIIAFQWKK